MPIQRLDKRSGNGERNKGLLTMFTCLSWTFLFVDKNYDRETKQNLAVKWVGNDINGCILTINSK